MKRIAILLLAAFITTVSVPVFAEDMKASKDECLLASKNCSDQVDSMQQKIKKLQTEINKGGKVYSPEEINRLNDKLKEANDMLNTIMLKP